ncbi:MULTISPECIES: YrdB family protein [Microbacterium]|uniref:YrdB family protein n=1 Tax=Microbacterium TaxID=33882 RepID=UPI000C2CC6A3|nr:MULTISPECIES: YrdB family protein [Microbacterium]MDO8381741.1 YrdB family protein [Microbacterium sp.]
MTDSSALDGAPQPASTPAGGTGRAPGMVERPGVIDIVRLLTELVAFGTLALWGFLAFAFPWNLVFGIGTPVFAILLWALFLSPRAVIAVHPFVAAFIELLIFVSATLAWWSLGQPWIGLAFGAVAVATGLVVGRRRFA